MEKLIRITKAVYETLKRELNPIKHKWEEFSFIAPVAVDRPSLGGIVTEPERLETVYVDILVNYGITNIDKPKIISGDEVVGVVNLSYEELKYKLKKLAGDNRVIGMCANRKTEDNCWIYLAISPNNTLRVVKEYTPTIYRPQSGWANATTL